MDLHVPHAMYACNESLDPKVMTITKALVILIIRRRCIGNLLWLHIEILQVFSRAIEQNL